MYEDDFPPEDFDDDPPESFEELDDDFEPVGWECLGCMKGFARPGDCPICGNPLEPYG